MVLGRILIVEDDKNIAKLLRYNLEKEGFVVDAVITGEDAFKVLDAEAIDLILLDVMLPKQDGFQICKQLKKDKNYADIPVIMLTARGEEVDRIVGLEIGAHDYIVKPFSPREVVLRIKSILKRNPIVKESDNREVLDSKGIKIDIARHRVYALGKEVQLTAMEFKLLETLMRRVGRVQDRDQLLQDVWNMQADVTTRTIDTHIKRLRQKLGKVGDAIETVRGMGYRFSDED